MAGRFTGAMKMGQGFLDDLPDLGMGKPRKRRKKKSVAGRAPIIYMRVRCPRCGSTKVPVYDSSHLPIRYHKCSKCGLNFKSVEKT